MALKKCLTCFRVLPFEDFYTETRIIKNTGERVPYRRPRCKSCVNTTRRLKQTATPHNFIRRSFSSLQSSRKLQGGPPVNLKLEDMFIMYEQQHGLCAITGTVMTYQSTMDNNNDRNISLDRIDSTKGYVLDNVQYVCKRVNLMKNKLAQKEFVGWCKLVSDKMTNSTHA